MEKIVLIPQFDALALIGKTSNGNQMLMPLKYDERTKSFTAVRTGIVFGSGFPEDYGTLDGNLHTCKVFGGAVAIGIVVPQKERNKQPSKRSGTKMVFYNAIPEVTKEIGTWSRRLNDDTVKSIRNLVKPVASVEEIENEAEQAPF